MKRLTLDQLRELGIFNPHDFAGKSGWYLRFVAYSRQTMGTAGWWVSGPSIPRESFKPGTRVRDMWGGSGKTHPSTMATLGNTLGPLGLTVPTSWIRFMGVWWDEDFFNRRMAACVAKYKERQGTASA